MFGTLLDFADDETPEHPWEVLSEYINDTTGASTTPEQLRSRRQELVDAEFARIDHVHSDVDMAVVYRQLVGEQIPTGAHLTPEELDKVPADAAWEFRKAATIHRSAFPGAIDMVEALKKDFRVSVASNTQRVYTEKELKAEDLYDCFEDMLFSSDVERGKPDPKLLVTSLERLRARPENAVYVGDNPHDDYIAALSAGLSFILIRHYGPYTHAELGVPASIPIVRSYEELLDQLYSLR